jgi:hypothetical protein
MTNQKYTSCFGKKEETAFNRLLTRFIRLLTRFIRLSTRFTRLLTRFIRVLTRFPPSPDLNPIEILWWIRSSIPLLVLHTQTQTHILSFLSKLTKCIYAFGGNKTVCRFIWSNPLRFVSSLSCDLGQVSPTS